MAQTHGNIANYPAQKRRELFMRLLILCMVLEAVAGFVVGLGLAGWLVPRPAGWVAIVLTWGGALVVAVLGVSFVRWAGRTEPAFFAYVKGAAAATADSPKS